MGLSFKSVESAVGSVPKLENEFKRSQIKSVITHTSPRLLIRGSKLKSGPLRAWLSAWLSVGEDGTAPRFAFQVRIAKDGGLARAEFESLLDAAAALHGMQEELSEGPMQDGGGSAVLASVGLTVLDDFVLFVTDDAAWQRFDIDVGDVAEDEERQVGGS